jgi:hypothetical protein
MKVHANHQEDGGFSTRQVHPGQLTLPRMSFFGVYSVPHISSVH